METENIVVNDDQEPEQEPHYHRRRVPLTSEKRQAAQELFLQAIAASGNVRRSAQLAGVSRETIYTWRRLDDDFAAAFADAEEDFADLLEQEAIRRGYSGVDQPVVSMGKVITDKDGNILTQKVYSDKLLERALSARHERYKPAASQTNVTVQQQAPQVVLLMPKLVPLPEPRVLVEEARRKALAAARQTIDEDGWPVSDG
jgi:hypothetical protein